MVNNQKVFILGMAKSGFAAAKLLASSNTVVITDQKSQNPLELRELEQLGVSFIQSEHQEELLDSSFQLVVKNPAIPEKNPVIEKARKLNILVINEMELAYHYLPNGVNLIGITGSNGKTTTTTLIARMLESDGRRTFVGGNIGVPFSSFVRDVKPNDMVVLEVSDHQLCDMYEFQTNVSVLTNIFKVHLDFHGSFERYKEMKKKIFAHHNRYQTAIINLDDEESLALTSDIESTKEYFSKYQTATCYIKENAIYYQNEKIIDLKDILLKGEHNYENIMAAICAVKVYGVDTKSIVDVLKTFQGVEHRLEYVGKIDNVSFYNDSKSTNAEATITALKSFQTPVLLILGGLDRGHSFEEIAPFMQHVKYVACYGETKFRIQSFCAESHIPCEVFENLREATTACFVKSEAYDTVLLSPACASWDQYDSFESRGKEFKEIVKELGSE